MQITDAIVIPIIVGVIEVLKNVGLSTKFSPLVSLILGVIAALALGGLSLENGVFGIIYGLSASGLYAGTKATLK